MTPSVLGIGNDIIEIERVRKSIATHGQRFLKKIFTSGEQAYCLKHKDPAPHFAGRFCAKEAVAKALGTGFGKHASWLDIEILNDSKGKPVVHFCRMGEKGYDQSSILVSISHCKLYVTAFALWVA